MAGGNSSYLSRKLPAAGRESAAPLQRPATFRAPRRPRRATSCGPTARSRRLPGALRDWKLENDAAAVVGVSATSWRIGRENLTG